MERARHDTPSTVEHVRVVSRAMRKVPDLSEFLGCAVESGPGPCRAVAGWGNRPSTRRARALALRDGVPFWSVEEGFLSRLSAQDARRSFSLLVDTTGVHYDAYRPCDLETLLNGPAPDAQRMAQAMMLRKALVQARLGKYGPGAPVRLGARRQPRVLLVDQLAGDAAIHFGMADESAFRAMADFARAHFADAQLLVKPHPRAGSTRQGVLQREWLADAQWLDGDLDVFELLEQVDHVLVVTSQTGMDALLVGRPVHCFGVPFYAGWGLTHDHRPAPTRRTRRLSVDELVAKAYLDYARYVHPVTHRRCTAFDIVEHARLQLRMRAAGPHRPLYVGVQGWKRQVFRRFSADDAPHGVFARRLRAQQLEPGQTVVSWGMRLSVQDEHAARQAGAGVVRVEDGFLRSVGLGSDLIAPLSLVFDAQGIHYDPSRPNDLNQMLLSRRFDDEERQRARTVRQRIVQHDLTKYNFPWPAAQRHAHTQRILELSCGRPVVLVPGQVADDASVLLGSTPQCRSMPELAHQVRAARPGCFIVYLPHPDVLSGNRKGDIDAVAPWVDLIEKQADALACLHACHEVHTLTSLMGFDALLRQKAVTTWGQPFYSGWGLTHDENPPPWAGRRTLLLDELVFAALVEYPRYLDWPSGAFIPVEQAIETLVRELAQQREQGLPYARTGRSPRLKKIWRWVDAWRHAWS